MLQLVRGTTAIDFTSIEETGMGTIMELENTEDDYSFSSEIGESTQTYSFSRIDDTSLNYTLDDDGNATTSQFTKSE